MAIGQRGKSFEQDKGVGVMEIRRIITADIVGDFIIRCEMKDGDIFDYDMSFVHEKEGDLFVQIRSPELFRKVWVESGALEWPHGLGIHAETVARDGELLKKTA